MCVCVCVCVMCVIDLSLIFYCVYVVGAGWLLWLETDGTKSDKGTGEACKAA